MIPTITRSVKLVTLNLTIPLPQVVSVDNVKLRRDNNVSHVLPVPLMPPDLIASHVGTILILPCTLMLLKIISLTLQVDVDFVQLVARTVTLPLTVPLVKRDTS